MSGRSAWWRLLVALVALGAAGALALAVYRLDPRSGQGLPLLPPCTFRELTGWACPGCGGTRAAHYFLHGDLRQALRLNPVVILFALTCLTGLAWALLGARWPKLGWWAAGTAVLYLAAALVYGVLRNLPGWPWPLP
jgi:hypothetical protein